MKLDLITNATVVDDAIRFMTEKSKDKENIRSAIEGDKAEAKEPDYDEDKDQLEEEQEEKETGETAAATINKVY